MVTTMAKAKGYTAATIAEAMYKLASPDAARAKFLTEYAAIKKEANQQAEGAYTKALKLAQSAGSMDVFLQGYDIYKSRHRATKGEAVDKSVQVAFSVISTAWFNLSQHCGKTITGTQNGKVVQIDVPAEAKDIPSAFQSFGAMRAGGNIAKALNTVIAEAGDSEGEESKATGKAGESKTDRALSNEVTSQLLVLTDRLRNMDQVAAQALLAETIAKTLAPSITPKAPAAKTTAKAAAARKRATRPADAPAATAKPATAQAATA